MLKILSNMLNNLSKYSNNNTLKNDNANKHFTDTIVPEISELSDLEIKECINHEVKIRINQNFLSADHIFDSQKIELHPYFREAAKIIVEHQEGSSTLLQRKLKVGYNQAGRLIDQLEFYGIISGFEGSKPRSVYIKNLEELELFLKCGEIISKEQIFFRNNLINNYENEISKQVEAYYFQIEEEEKQKRIEAIKSEIIEKERLRQQQLNEKQLRAEIEKELSEQGLIPIFDSLKTNRSVPISQDVQDKVWNRDGGRCVKCSGTEKLEFDHIIPFSRGGSNTYRNLQLLCENCNRSKSNKIG